MLVDTSNCKYLWDRDLTYLVLLVFGNQIVHVGLGLAELHLVHTLNERVVSLQYTWYQG